MLCYYQKPLQYAIIKIFSYNDFSLNKSIINGLNVKPIFTHACLNDWILQESIICLQGPLTLLFLIFVLQYVELMIRCKFHQFRHVFKKF